MMMMIPVSVPFIIVIHWIADTLAITATKLRITIMSFEPISFTNASAQYAILLPNATIHVAYSYFL